MMRAELCVSLLILSVLFIVIAACKLLWDYCRHRPISLSKQLMFAAVMVFLALLPLRYLIIMMPVIEEETMAAAPNWWSALFEAILKSMRTFMTDGEVSIVSTFSSRSSIVRHIAQSCTKHADLPWLTTAWNIYEFLLDVAAPLLGGAAILSVIFDMFPALRIKCSPFMDKYIFTELNEESVSLAESIYAFHLKNKKRVMLIFTDTYVDEDNEHVSELYMRTKNIGCLCVKTDIQKLKVRTSGKIYYILSDLDQMRNLSAALAFSNMYSASELTGAQKKKKTSPRNNHQNADNDATETSVFRTSAQVPNLCHANYFYVFSNADETEEILRKVRDNFKQYIDTHIKQEPALQMPVIVPVKEFKHIVYSLLDDMPLFTPLLDNAQKKQGKEQELNVTIFGTGKIGTEAFLAAFWCGQMLNVHLNLTVISIDARTGFYQRINRISPDIFGSTKGKDHFLPYCSISLAEYDLSLVNFDELLQQDFSDKIRCKVFGDYRTGKLFNTDYFILSLGDDKLNLDTTFMLKRSLERQMLKDDIQCKKVIACSIYDNILNHSMADNGESSGIIIHPFASFESRFSYENIFQKRFIKGAQCISDSYSTLHGEYETTDMDDLYGKVGKEFDYYKHWSNIARTLHGKYRMFSVGAAYDKTEFLRKIRQPKFSQDLAWLEHRRWNACLWTMGYAFFDAPKQLNTKRMHPCLVETGMSGAPHHKIPLDPKTARNVVLTNPSGRYDTLDIISVDYYEGSDVKRYDYPQNSGLLLTCDELFIYLTGKSKEECEQVTADDLTIINDDATIDLFKCYKDEKIKTEQWKVDRYFLDQETYDDIKNGKADADVIRRKLGLSTEPRENLTAAEVWNEHLSRSINTESTPSAQFKQSEKTESELLKV